jgi:hypothetical protein
MARTGIAGGHWREGSIAVRRRPAAMPTLSTFYGIVIRMYFRDHASPHFHALYGEDETLIEIRALRVMAGRLPLRALDLTLQWASSHQAELLEDWELCRLLRHPKPIDPLE